MPRHAVDVALRWSDTDAYGHVNNTVFVRYLQEARVAMMLPRTVLAESGTPEEALLVARHEVSYLHELTYRREPVRVETWVRQIRAASFTLGYEIVDPPAHRGERRVYVVASSTLVPVNLASWRPRRLNEVERAQLGTYLDPDGPVPERRRPVPTVAP